MRPRHARMSAAYVHSWRNQTHGGARSSFVPSLSACACVCLQAPPHTHLCKERAVLLLECLDSGQCRGALARGGGAVLERFQQPRVLVMQHLRCVDKWFAAAFRGFHAERNQDAVACASSSKRCMRHSLRGVRHHLSREKEKEKEKRAPTSAQRKSHFGRVTRVARLQQRSKPLILLI